MYTIENLRLTPEQYQTERNPEWSWVATGTLNMGDLLKVHNIKVKVKNLGTSDAKIRLQFPLERNTDGSVRGGSKGAYESAHPASGEARTAITLAFAAAVKAATATARSVELQPQVDENAPPPEDISNL